MRIVGGRHRGRRLRAPYGRRLRPTSDRVRESVFNVLTQCGARIGGTDAVRGARVLDAFAGTGAMALEALSRGAAHATLMDDDRDALGLCRANAAALGEAGNATVLQGDCLAPVRAAQPCTLVLLDPPYGQGLAAPALAALAAAGWVARGALIVVELAAREEFAPPQAEILDQRRYGAATVVFLRWAGETA